MDAAGEAIAIAQVRSWLVTGRAREIRERARLSQAEVARAVGTDGPQVSRWEAGKGTPRDRGQVLRLAMLLRELDGISRAEASPESGPGS